MLELKKFEKELDKPSAMATFGNIYKKDLNVSDIIIKNKNNSILS
jgi:hypothetical protein